MADTTKSRISVTLDDGVEEALRGEVERVRREVGVEVSLSSVAARAIRTGLGLGSAKGEEARP